MLCILCCLIVRVSLILTAIHLGWLFCFLYSVQNAARTRCIFLASVGSSPLLFIVLSQANMVTAKCSFGIFKRRVIWNLIFSLGSCIFHIEIFEKHRELTVVARSENLLIRRTTPAQRHAWSSKVEFWLHRVGVVVVVRI